MVQHHKMSVAFLTMPNFSKVPGKPGHILREGLGRVANSYWGVALEIKGSLLKSLQLRP